jgi:hypothetical protein
MKVLFGGKLVQEDNKVQAKGNYMWTYQYNHIDEGGAASAHFMSV